MSDQLVEGESSPGLVVLNHGDPSYRHPADQCAGLTPAENIFLRMVAYLVFVEQVAIPARYILEGDDIAEAVKWATPLLSAGLIRPERRADVSSFEELAHRRGLSPISHQRGKFLDRTATAPRAFRWTDLSSSYRVILEQDLQRGGGFRRTFRGAMTGKYAGAIDKAYETYLATTDGTPEGFISTVTKCCPAAKGAAARWAMAR